VQNRISAVTVRISVVIERILFLLGRISAFAVHKQVNQTESLIEATAQQFYKNRCINLNKGK
jgi:hypothetical protein